MVKLTLLTFVVLCLSVAVRSFVITYSTPQQCGDVEIAWTQSSISAAQFHFPLLLHILPFDSTAISEQIPGWNASMTSGSAVVNYKFNMSIGAGFLLAVTDGIGQGVGPVSEVKVVIPSRDTSCLSTSTPGPPGHFQVFTSPNASECPSLNVQWDGTVKSPRPTILGFSPGQYPVDLDPSSSPLPTERSVLSTGTFTSMSKVIVLFRDSDFSGRTSQFLTVGGTDNDGCSRPSNPTCAHDSLTSTIPVCVNQSDSSKTVDKVIGGAVAGAVGLAILLLVIFAYLRRRQHAAHEFISESQVPSAKANALPSRPSHRSISDDLRLVPPPIPPPIPPTNSQSEANSDKDKEPQELKRDIVTTPSPVHSVPLSLPMSPLTRRRSWTSRSMLSMTTDESNFLQFTEASTFRPTPFNETDGASPMQVSEGKSPPVHEDPVSRPDSPTLPELQYPQVFALPKTPRTPRSRSQRSQRSEKRENYPKLDPTSEVAVSEEPVRSPRSPSNRMSRASRTSRTQKAQ